LPGETKERNRIGSEDLSKPTSSGFRPSDYMRARRPQLFSDTRITRELKLPPAVLDHYLASLTSRKQEVEFEHLCRRLAEKELCPNLLPQTGPTGGGDSKVDSENYPVADEISLRWYEGLTTTGRNQERWGFAFSAKKAWRSKVQSDVLNIAGTRRGYKLIYFITNQFVPDKMRAQLEDSLKKRHRIPVRILDKRWIMKCVFEHSRIPLAVETLHMTGYEVDQEIAGPRDTKRKQELEQLEQDIGDQDRYRGVKYQLAEDCLRSALVARGLEVPRVEVEGRFARAERIALDLGNGQQRLRIAYAKAWTTFWWFDDFAQFNELYGTVEELALGTGQSDDLELLTNLWSLLAASVGRGQLDVAHAKLEARTAALRADLERLAADAERPNNALWARTSLLLMDLQSAVNNPEVVSSVLSALRGVVANAEGLISYPLTAIAKLVQEFGDFLGDNVQYDELFETITDIMQRRLSDGEAGRMLLARGIQKLRSKLPYDAIRFYGRAQQKLAKREYRAELIAALVGGGMAYESAGLLWAARANVLNALNQTFAEFWENGSILPQALACLHRLVWLELQLGRVPAVLRWIELGSMVAHHLALGEKKKRSYLDERFAQDGVLGILLLEAEMRALHHLESLPPVLDELGLGSSWMALLYALGYEDRLRAEGAIPNTEDERSVRDFFEKWIKQPAVEDLPSKPDLFTEDTVILHSSVLGSAVTAHVDNDFDSLSLGEQLLASLEGLLATSMEGVFPHAEEFTIRVIRSSSAKTQPEHKFEEGETAQVLTVTHGGGWSSKSSVSSSHGEWLQKIVIEIALRIAFIDNIQAYAERVFRQEAGLGRAINFSNTATPLKNILGDGLQLHISEWQPHDQSPEKFPLRRGAPWYEGIDLDKKGVRLSPIGEGIADGEPPKELLDFTAVKHNQRRVFSLINMPLWDNAKWGAVAYGITPDLSEPPILGLAFGDSDAARAIFKGWRSKLGQFDEQEQLHVCIVTEISRGNPYAYGVVIGSNPKIPSGTGLSHFIAVSRVHTMNPTDSTNLERFLARFKRVGVYALAPARFSEGQPPQLFLDLCIGKAALRVIPAWKLGRNDPDAVVIGPDDDPIIPQWIGNAPVLAVLEKLRSKKRVSKF
jgi:hypothetical protein